MSRHDTSDTLPWTAERANRALPLVRRIAADLVQRYAEWQSLVGDFELASTRHSHADEAEATRLAQEVQHAATEIEGFVRELTELGVEVKSLETGLLDFPGEMDGRPVLFCWMLGEPRVAHWHEVDAGFAGRQPL
ncbi:MAG TPA: DUF2203 domain-containing protein [Gemmatimonadaceae bacterium]|nr:DUF2203 domain-containing protein [Gemmatimonadaceae bacterium]